MAATALQQNTSRFYEWESRCRGWYLYETAVELEPPFEPFYKVRNRPVKFVDDGRVPTLLDRLINALPFSKKKEEDDIIELQPYLHEQKGYLSACSIALPKGATVTAEDSERLLLMISTCGNPVSFEIIATGASIILQFVCLEKDSHHLISQIKAFLFECIISDTTAELNTLLSNELAICVLDLGLNQEFIRPLKTIDDFSSPAFTGLFGALDHLQENERVVIQILFDQAVEPWAPSIVQSVTAADGKSFFLDAPEMPKLAQSKIASPLFGVVIRVMGQGATISHAQAVTMNVARIVSQTTQSSVNSLIPLSNEDYPDEWHIADVIYRQSHRLGMLLNSKELATLVHIPSASISATKLNTNVLKTKVAPSNEGGVGLVLGINTHQGKERTVSISAAQRLRHTHIIGATGTGKSTLLQNLISQDVASGRGFAVLDPHGDLIESILDRIPANRINDVVVIDPSDAQYPVAFNILLAHSEIEREVLSSDLVAIFRRLSTSWGDAMNSVFANGILAFLESSEGGTLMDLRRFFVEKNYRDTFLKTVSDPSVVYYWTKEYPLVKSNSIGSILTRMDAFLRPKLIRNMVAQKGGLDFGQLMDSNKILLVKLPQGLIGTENSYLLGSIFVSKIYQAAMARQNQDMQIRKDFTLYVDEFQNFIVPSMSHILSGARKYRLGLVLAHQDMQQLVKEDSELASAVTSNAGTRICFRLGDTDAKRFESSFSFFDASDLQNLRTGEAIARIDRADNDFNLSIPNVVNGPHANLKHAVIEQSRKRYATPREEVERVLEYLHQEINTELRPEEEEVDEQKQEAPKEKRLKQREQLKQIIDPGETVEYLIKQKEQSQHRYLQTLIKSMAESRGFKALIEEPTPDGKGKVDVSLERNGKRIACEIGVTTTKDWEVHNIEKCLAAGYDWVIAVSTEPKTLALMQKKVDEKIPSALISSVLVLDADGLFMMLDNEVAKNATTEKRVKGYRVKVEYDAVSNDALRYKKESIAKAITHNINR